MSKDGGHAFPVHHDILGYKGMSLRDYFARGAMDAAITAAASWGCVNFRTDIDVEPLAEFAYRAADAMLKERDK